MLQRKKESVQESCFFQSIQLSQNCHLLTALLRVQESPEHGCNENGISITAQSTPTRGKKRIHHGPTSHSIAYLVQQMHNLHTDVGIRLLIIVVAICFPPVWSKRQSSKAARSKPVYSMKWSSVGPYGRPYGSHYGLLTCRFLYIRYFWPTE